MAEDNPKLADLFHGLKRPNADALASIVVMTTLELLAERFANMPADQKAAMVERIRANAIAEAAQVVASAPKPFLKTAKEQLAATETYLDVFIALAAAPRA